MKRVLVIDDAAEIRQVLREMLQRTGYEVLEAANGKEGIRCVHTEPIDLVITDIIMPEKEGIETIQELQRDFPEVKIIATSGGGRIGAQYILRAARLLGVPYTLAKPIGRADLLLAVQELLGGPGST